MSSSVPKFSSLILASKFFIKLKCSVISVYRILEIKSLRNSLNCYDVKLGIILVAGAHNNFIEVAAWCYSNTLLSWYLIAKLDKLLISKMLVLPVWDTSWHNPDIINANFVN